MFSDAAGHRTGNTQGIDAGSVVLTTAAGEMVGRSDAAGRLTVEGIDSRARWYVLTARAKRTHPSWPLSTHVQSQWRFRSGDVPRGARALPLIDVRYDVPLSDHQSIVAGNPTRLSLWARRQVGSPRADARVMRVEYSTDGGSTWTQAAVDINQGRTQATIPGLTAGTVALRVTAADSAGGRLVETLTNAYFVQ
jgi:hypothetical protein